MKIRTDFVTNSSSSSFILAKKDDLTPEQKDEIVENVMDIVMGEIVLPASSTEEQIEKFEKDYYMSEERMEKIRSALKEGKDIYYGHVYDEPGIPDWSELCKIVWKILEKDPETFTGIRTDLYY